MSNNDDKYKFPHMGSLFGPQFYKDDKGNIKPQTLLRGPIWSNDLQADIYEVVIMPFRDETEARLAAEKISELWEKNLDE